MDYQTIKYDISERILTITLNRPEQMNAFTVEMANELEHAFYRHSAAYAGRYVAKNIVVLDWQMWSSL